MLFPAAQKIVKKYIYFYYYHLCYFTDDDYLLFFIYYTTTTNYIINKLQQTNQVQPTNDRDTKSHTASNKHSFALLTCYKPVANLLWYCIP